MHTPYKPDRRAGVGKLWYVHQQGGEATLELGTNQHSVSGGHYHPYHSAAVKTFRQNVEQSETASD